jgi:hypothetical protein
MRIGRDEHIKLGFEYASLVVVHRATVEFYSQAGLVVDTVNIVKHSILPAKVWIFRNITGGNPHQAHQVSVMVCQFGTIPSTIFPQFFAQGIGCDLGKLF